MSAHTVGSFVVLRISPTISNEFATRNPEDVPESCYCTGKVSVSLASARAILADAEFNSDTKVFEVGEYGMPLPIFNAYRALAKQARAAIAKAGSSYESR